MDQFLCEGQIVLILGTIFSDRIGCSHNVSYPFGVMGQLTAVLPTNSPFQEMMTIMKAESVSQMFGWGRDLCTIVYVQPPLKCKYVQIFLYSLA